MDDRDRPPVRATDTSVTIIEGLIRTEGATVTELADDMEMSKSSVHDHLQTLERLGFVVTEGWEYRVSLRFLEVGAIARRRYRLYREGLEELRHLADVSGRTATFSVLERGKGVCLHSIAGEPVETQVLRTGDTFPLYCTAAGKAILAAHEPDRARERLSSVSLEAVTENTTTSVEELMSELSTIRARGLARTGAEWRSDVSGIAAAITDAEDDVLGAVGVVSSSESLSGKRFQQDVPGLVISARNQIRNRIQTS